MLIFFVSGQPYALSQAGLTTGVALLIALTITVLLVSEDIKKVSGKNSNMG